MRLLKNEIHVWRYQVADEDHRAESITPMLSSQEKARASKFLRVSDKARYIAIHRFLRIVLAEYASAAPETIRFRKSEFGKPSLYYEKEVKGRPAIHFNLSYRGEYALLAVSVNCEPGIDIELIRTIDDPEAFCSNYFCENERGIIRKTRQEKQIQMIFTFWTFKEAFIKALGIGFSKSLTRFDLSPFIDQSVHRVASNENKIWTIRKLPAPDGYEAAIAASGKGLKIVEMPL